MEQNMDEFIEAPGSEFLIKGAGGGGKGRPSSPPPPTPAVEAANTLRSAAVARIVEVISEGPIEGIAGGGQGIYINDTPLFNSGGTSNFVRAQWDYRVGLPSQDYMPGFNGVESEVSVNTPVSIASNNIIRAVSSGAIDAVMVTMQLPNGLSEQNTTTGDLNGSSVTFNIERRLGTGPFNLVGSYTITGKTTSPYEAAYRIPRPPGSGTWSVRVVRQSADPAASVRNQTSWARMTEIQEVQVSYPDAAVVGIAIDAESVGNTIPKRAYLVKGVLLHIPSNLNPATRVYTGAWNGLLTASTIAFDNPVWALYDVLTNTRYGAGLASSDIDLFSFYDASVYCDQSVTFTSDTGASTTEPRYTFNARIADRPDIMKIVRSICGSMAANLIYWNGKWTLIQDRPTSVSKLVTKANVIDGMFTYKSSGLFERHTAINVSFNDRADRHLERVVTVEDTTGIARYGYQPTDIAAFGCTTEGQAIRAGKWVLDTELHQSEICEWKMSLNGFDLCPGDVVNVYDEDYANTSGGGKVVSYTAASTSVVLDRAVSVTSGSTITALLADGRTLQTRTISGTGSLSTLTITAAFSTALHAQADFIITSAIAPRPFKIIDVTVPELNVVEVKAAFYDANKFTRIETGVVLPSATFSNYIGTVVTPPTSLVLVADGILLPNGLPRRMLRASWTAPTNGAVAGYNVLWTVNDGQRQTLDASVTSALIPADEDGIYKVWVMARDFSGNVSTGSATATFTMTSNVLTVDPSGFGPPTNFVAVDSNSTTWSQDDLVVRWADNPTNTRAAVEYLIEVYTTNDILLRSVTIPGGTRQYNYDMATNRNDGSGFVRGALKMKVYAKDVANAYSNPTTVTFTNPAPASVTGFTADGMYKAASLKWTANTENDLQGYYVWRGTSSGFTPSTSNLVYTGLVTSYLDGVLPDNTQYYYKIAAFDKFNTSQSGTGLNIVVANATSTGKPGIAGFATAPTTGMVAGDFYYNTTDGNLYKYDGTVWRVTGMYSGTTSQMNVKSGMVVGDLWSNTSDNKLYRWNGSLWTAAVPVVDLSGQITSTQITDGAISTPKLAANAVTANEIAANAITAGKIATNAIVAANIQAGQIDSNKLAASSVIAGKVAANAITTGNIQAGAITSGSGIIADLAVTTLKLGPNTVTLPFSGGMYNQGVTNGLPNPCTAQTGYQYLIAGSNILTFVNCFGGGAAGAAYRPTDCLPMRVDVVFRRWNGGSVIDTTAGYSAGYYIGYTTGSLNWTGTFYVPANDYYSVYATATYSNGQIAGVVIAAMGAQR